MWQPRDRGRGLHGNFERVVAAISERLNRNVGRLRNTHQFSKGTDGITFITAEIHDPEKGKEDRHDKGDLATWATENEKSGQFQSVDEHARTQSTWPPASFDVRKKGAYESRVCTNISRGKSKAQIECEQEQSDPNAPAIPGGKECDEL